MREILTQKRKAAKEDAKQKRESFLCVAFAALRLCVRDFR